MAMDILAVYAPDVMARRRPAYNLSEPEPGTLGYFVRQRRDELGLTQQDLADRMSDLGGRMTQGDISDLESPTGTKLPRPPRMILLSRALEVSLGELYAAAGYPEHAAVGPGVPSDNHTRPSREEDPELAAFIEAAKRAERLAGKEDLSALTDLINRWLNSRHRRERRERDPAAG